MPKHCEEARVQKFVERWKARLLVNNWGIVIQYPDEDRNDDNGKSVLADMTPNPRYTDGILNIYPAFFREPIDRQEAVIVHEVAHINTERINAALCKAVNRKAISERHRQDIKEDITEQLCKIAFKAYKQRRKKDKYII